MFEKAGNQGVSPTSDNPFGDTTDKSQGFSHLSASDRVLAQSISKPRWMVYGATALAVLLSWFWLTSMAASVATSGAAQLGPSMLGLQSLLGGFSDAALNSTFVQFLLKICSPYAVTTLSIEIVLGTLLMWLLMSVAMMLPSAAPMLRTYADIADVAAQKNEKVVSVGVLAVGYGTMWMLFSLLATAVQLGLALFGAVDTLITPLQGALGGMILLGAGVYQFSALKHACLEKCRNPFSIIFGRWSGETGKIFKLGAEQGLFCIGCCWALMLVMLVVGTMNLVWMAFFTLFTIIEKSGRGKVTSHFSGGILIAWGLSLIALSIYPAFFA